MVTDLQGTAFFADGGGRAPVAILSELAKGTKLKLEKDAVLAIVYIKSGTEFRVTGPGKVEIAQDIPRLTGAGKLLRQPQMFAAKNAKLAVDNGRVIQAAIVMRSAPDPNRSNRSSADNDGRENQTAIVKREVVTPLAPKGKILARRPVFQWIPGGNKGKTVFGLFDLETQETIAEASVDGSIFALPEHVELVPGRAYVWTLHPEGDDSAMRTWEFTLASNDEFHRFMQLQPAANASFSKRVVYATLLEQAELRQEAKAVWKALAAERPEQTEIGQMAER